MHKINNQAEYDVLVIGSGAGGFSAAITALDEGLSVLMVEKDVCFGGTTSRSGGYIWIPGNRLAEKEGIKDDANSIRTYLRNELGDSYGSALLSQYLKSGPEMVDFFVNKVGVEFMVATQMPDYHPDLPGSSQGGRSLHVKPTSASILGDELPRLRPLPRELSLFGMGISSGSDLSHFYRFGRSVRSTVRVITLLAKYGLDLLRFGRGQHLVNGNALIARLARALFDKGGSLWTSSPATELLMEGGRVAGAVVVKNGQPIHVRAKKGVVLASGGFSHDVNRRSAIYKHPARSGEHLSLTTPGNEGDGARLAESAGGHVDTGVTNAGAWMPISKVPRPDGTWGPFLHSVNQGKPGMIAVLRNGERFADESLSYHDFVEKLISMPEAGRPAGAYLICDHKAFSKYGLGYAKPFLSTKKLEASGYLITASTVTELATKAHIDPDVLANTVSTYNISARDGLDPAFGKGKSAYGHFLGDLTAPNPNVAPLEQAPFYAVWMYAGDIGNFAGIKTNENAQVVREDGVAIEGLFAVGNDMSSVFNGRYPGGGSLIGPAMTFGYVAAKFLSRTDGAVSAQ